MDRIRLKFDSRKDMDGRFTDAVLPFLLLIALQWCIDIFSAVARYSGNETVNAIFATLASFVGIAWFFISFTIMVGISRYYLDFVNGITPPTSSVFDDLKKGSVYWEELKAYVATSLLILLGTICLIIPGIYLALRFSQVKFVFAQHPEYSRSQAVKRSAMIMKGHYMEFLGLVLSFILWYLFGIITFGIGMLYVYPYTHCAYARYYLSISELYDRQSGDYFEGINTDNQFANNSDSTEEQTDIFEETI